MHQQQRNLTDSKLFNGSKYQKLREKILHYYSNLLVHVFIPKGMHGQIYFKNYILIQGISCWGFIFQRNAFYIVEKTFLQCNLTVLRAYNVWLVHLSAC